MAYLLNYRIHYQLEGTDAKAVHQRDALALEGNTVRETSCLQPPYFTGTVWTMSTRMVTLESGIVAAFGTTLLDNVDSNDHIALSHELNKIVS
jgi:hypothetical protein